MKLATLILAGSVALNVALAAIFLGASSAPSVPPAPAPRSSAPATTAPAAPGPETWTALQSGDFAAQRDRLRDEGFPPALVRSILTARIREGFAARRKALDNASADVPFWKTTNPSPAAQAELRALNKEEAKALRDLLGPDPDSGYSATLRRQVPGLPDDKVDQLALIRSRFEEQRQDLYGNIRSGPPTPDDREKIRALEKTQRADIAAVLTPAEFEDYQLRAGDVANNLRFNLSAFNANEAEFRALYRLQQDFNDAHGDYPMGQSSAEQRAWSEAQMKLTNDIKAALGPERAADYERATDYNYQQSTKLIARLGLPPETANQVYAVQKDIQARSNSTTPAERGPLVAEAQTKLTTLLGASGYEAYKQYGGSWIQYLTPRPKS